MRLHFYKYHGAGNDFVLFDARKNDINLSVEQITKLCDRHFGVGADGVILLKKTPMADFEMAFYNPDGTSGMMCGNGGRCITMFARHIGVSNNSVFSFLASDGMHFARVVDEKTVALKMTNTDKLEIMEDGIWIDTGTSHFVTFVKDLSKADVVAKGRKLRYEARFEKHNGTNVDFVAISKTNDISVRTYERGVEDETLACGTGIVASALVYSIKKKLKDGKHSINVNTLHDNLTVEFEKNGNSFSSIMLIGSAVKVFEGDIVL